MVYNQSKRITRIYEGKDMQETNVVELRRRIKHYFDAVENGEVIRVYRKGKPIAEILPLTKREASWKREVPRLTIPGLSLSREILKDRAESDS
jgi:prevent-host-death family protein